MVTLPRFYFPGEIFTGKVVELSIAAAHHAVRVLRLKEGSGVVLFNGNGGEFQSVIVRIGRTGAAVAVGQHLPVERESRLAITLVQAVCANEKMDWIVQKAVELGVFRIQPVVTARSVVRLSGERGERRAKHLQRIAISACEQCGRNRVPCVLAPAPLEGWLGAKANRAESSEKSENPEIRMMLSPTAEKGLRDLPLPSRSTCITLLVGPEGGFTPDEESTVRGAGFVSVRLGDRILRVESAALAGIAAMQVLWGDY